MKLDTFDIKLRITLFLVLHNGTEIEHNNKMYALSRVVTSNW